MLAENMNTIASDLNTHGTDSLNAYTTEANSLLDIVIGDATFINDDFATRAQDCLDTFNMTLDDLVTKWAWWLLKYFDYMGYPESVYEGYDPEYEDDWTMELTLFANQAYPGDEEEEKEEEKEEEEEEEEDDLNDDRIGFNVL